MSEILRQSFLRRDRLIDFVGRWDEFNVLVFCDADAVPNPAHGFRVFALGRLVVGDRIGAGTSAAPVQIVDRFFDAIHALPEALIRFGDFVGRAFDFGHEVVKACHIAHVVHSKFCAARARPVLLLSCVPSAHINLNADKEKPAPEQNPGAGLIWHNMKSAQREFSDGSAQHDEAKKPESHASDLSRLRLRRSQPATRTVQTFQHARP